MKGKTVVVTGGTSGIGKVAAEKLAEMGARLVLVARDRSRGEGTLARLREKAPGLAHTVHYADLTGRSPILPKSYLLILFAQTPAAEDPSGPRSSRMFSPTSSGCLQNRNTHPPRVMPKKEKPKIWRPRRPVKMAAQPLSRTCHGSVGQRIRLQQILTSWSTLYNAMRASFLRERYRQAATS
jgi:short chain dehydrogenase